MVNIKNSKTLKYCTFKKKQFFLLFVGRSAIKIFKKEESIEMFKILDLIIYIKKKTGQEFILKEIDEKRNYLIKEIKQNELVSKKHKKNFKFYEAFTYFSFYSY